jgi:signal transduction histidine kinase
MLDPAHPKGFDRLASGLDRPSPPEEQDELLRAIGDRLPRSFFFRVVHETDGRTWFAYVSRGVEELLGISAADLSADFDAFLRLIVPQDTPAYEAAVGLAMATLGGADVVFRVIRPDFQLRWCHLRSATRRGPDGALLCEGVMLDVTERKLAEAALHESEARLKAMVAALPDMVFTIALDGTFLDVHARDSSDLAVPPDAIVGHRVGEILPPDLAARIHASFDHVEKTGDMQVVEYELPVGGRPGYFEARIVPCGADRFLTIVRNITEMRLSQAETHRARLELGRAGRLSMLGEIAASMAHELNQPLAAIVSNARAGQRLLQGGGEIDEVLDDIAQSGLRAGEVIRHVRGMLARDTNTVKPLSMNDVILEVEPLIRSELLIRSVTLSLVLSPEIPAVNADTVQLQQVLLNLALNAMEAMDTVASGERRLTVSTAVLDGHVEVVVRDTGPGFAPETLGRVFEPFYTTKERGLGFGLRLCASIIEAHGGAIAAEQAAEGGALVRFSLPSAAHVQGSSADGP